MAAAIVAALFGALLAQQWLTRQKPHQAAWAIAMIMFAVASFAAGLGVLDEWRPMTYRAFYLFGAILNVPVLALGTIYLLGPRRFGHALAALLGIAAIFAAGSVFTADLSLGALNEASRSGQIASGSDVMPDGVRTLSRYFSYTFVIVVGGALWSSWRMARSSSEGLRDLAIGNILIATGTLIAAAGSIFARYGQGAIFAVGLLIGVVVMFLGFLKARPKPALSEPAGDVS
jgi:hypothetical protein